MARGFRCYPDCSVYKMELTRQVYIVMHHLEFTCCATQQMRLQQLLIIRATFVYFCLTTTDRSIIAGAITAGNTKTVPAPSLPEILKPAVMSYHRRF